MGRQPRFLHSMERPLALLAKVCTCISGFCLILLVVTFGWLVFGRYILNSTPTWVEQLALLLIVLITFLSSAVGIKEKTHLSVEILPYLLKKRSRSVLYIFIYLILGGFGLIMMVQSYHLTVFNWSTIIPLLDIPEGYRTLPMVISGGLVSLFSLGNILQEICSLLTKDHRVNSPNKNSSGKNTQSEETTNNTSEQSSLSEENS
ncbi:MAG: TRAP transporter small permease [Halopseudomonas aestusnigri]